ncbi:hypothetical protein FIC_01111 [Flavobacteriaceae bacterium 3519-10]|nr:hypothetical protein FIC_01111 [Flavobacteriaceae bacterium 3519-10]
MLEKGRQELAVSCGIMSSSNFLHLFSEIYGTSLSEYREQCRKKFAGEEGQNHSLS